MACRCRHAYCRITLCVDLFPRDQAQNRDFERSTRYSRGLVTVKVAVSRATHDRGKR